MNPGIETPEQKKSFWQIVTCGLALCVALSAAGYFFGVSPAIAHLSEGRANRAELTQRQQSASDLKSDLAAARKRLSAAKNEVAALPLRLEPASAVNNRLKRLAEVAAAAGVTLNEMQPQPAVDGQHFQTVPIRMAGSGTFPMCATLLHELRMQFPDTAVGSIDTINNAPARDGNVAAFRLDLAWHTAPPAK